MRIADATPSRFRWLDRWLEPRWRALLTWLVLAAVTEVLWHMLNRPKHSMAAQYLDSLYLKLGLLFPLVVLKPLRDWAIPMMYLFYTCWFPPFILRLGNLRSALWLFGAVVLWFVWYGVYVAARGSGPAMIPWLHAFDAAGYGYFGLLGLVVVGRRSRPWMTLLGGILAGCLAYPFIHEQFLIAPRWVYVATSVLYGAVMLYGTDPLPHRPAERQLGED